MEKLGFWSKISILICTSVKTPFTNVKKRSYLWPWPKTETPQSWAILSWTQCMTDLAQYQILFPNAAQLSQTRWVMRSTLCKLAPPLLLRRGVFFSPLSWCGTLKCKEGIFAAPDTIVQLLGLKMVSIKPLNFSQDTPEPNHIFY